MNPIVFVSFALACVGMGAAWAVWWRRYHVEPRLYRQGRRDGEAALEARVAAAAREYVAGDGPRVAGVCEGGPMDGLRFFHPLSSQIARWEDGAGRHVGTYCQSFRQADGGRWIFRHVPAGAKTLERNP